MVAAMGMRHTVRVTTIVRLAANAREAASVLAAPAFRIRGNAKQRPLACFDRPHAVGHSNARHRHPNHIHYGRRDH